MQAVLLPNQVRELDQQAADGIGGYLYMRRAGEALFQKVCELLESGEWKSSKSLRAPVRPVLPLHWNRLPVLILAGHGNNGGDGVVLAELLHKASKAYRLVLFRDPAEFKNEALQAWNDFVSAGGAAELFSSVDSLRTLLEDSGLVVDAMLGTGAKGELQGNILLAVDCIQSVKNPVLAVDVPTGAYSPDHTQVLQADWSLLLGFARVDACFENPGRYFGQWDVANLNYPSILEKPFLTGAPLQIAGVHNLAQWLPPRDSWVGKHQQGILGIVAGSRGMTGAASLCANAAMRSGVGLVHLAAPESEVPTLASKLTEIVLHGMKSSQGALGESSFVDIQRLLLKCSAACIGPGLSIQAETQELVVRLVEEASCPLVLDADGLNAFRGLPELLGKVKHALVLTPHDGEWERVFGFHPGEGLTRVESVSKICKEYCCVVVLKGAPTLIGNPDGVVAVLPTANSALAKAGSGDVLAGLIASFLGQGVEAWRAAQLGCWLHARGGIYAAHLYGQRGALPSDLLLQIPIAIMELEKELLQA